MPKPKVLALVMAGGEGSRLELLTERRAKPAIPFAGVFRLIDFPLSNCVHSGIEGVWVLQQYRLQSLNDELANGRPWDLDRTYGGLRLLPPQLGSGEEDGFHEGNADAIWRNRQLIAEHDPEVVLVLSGDHVYRLDYGEVLARHRDREAGVTVVTTEVPDEREASRLAVVKVADDGRLRGFHYKPDEPPTTRVATEVFAFETGRLLATLDELAAGDGELKDFGHGLLPRMDLLDPVPPAGAGRPGLAGAGPGAAPSAGLGRGLGPPGQGAALAGHDCLRRGDPLGAGAGGGGRARRVGPRRGAAGRLRCRRRGPGRAGGAGPGRPGRARGPGGLGRRRRRAGLVAENTQIPPGATVAPGGRLGPDGAEEPAV